MPVTRPDAGFVGCGKRPAIDYVLTVKGNCKF
jgi:hypothetical protein